MLKVLLVVAAIALWRVSSAFVRVSSSNPRQEIAALYQRPAEPNTTTATSGIFTTYPGQALRLRICPDVVVDGRRYRQGVIKWATESGFEIRVYPTGRNLLREGRLVGRVPPRRKDWEGSVTDNTEWLVIDADMTIPDDLEIGTEVEVTVSGNWVTAGKNARGTFEDTYGPFLVTMRMGLTDRGHWLAGRKLAGRSELRRKGLWAGCAVIGLVAFLCIAAVKRWEFEV